MYAPSQEEKMANFQCEANEKELGRWTTNFIPHGGGRYTGQLIVTDQRIVFHSQFDTSLKGVVGDLFFAGSDNHEFICIPFDNIREVYSKIRLLNKRVIIDTDNDQNFVIDNGMLPVQKIFDAIQKNR